MLVRITDRGLFCEAGGFFIDPWGPVERAVITHAHSDHARYGSKLYMTASGGAEVLRARLGDDAHIEAVPYGETRSLNGVLVSLHPAGHILGSSQVRIEHRGEVLVASGDYKLEPDSTCPAFEPVRCHTFITESTFGLPVYRWRPQTEVFAEINAWWRSNQEKEKASILFGYSLGKAQRLLSGLDPGTGPVYCHGAVFRLNEIYRRAGVRLPEAAHAGSDDFRRAMILAPPSANGSPWLRRFGNLSTAFASGWMRLRGPRRRSAIDRGFALSDHADWPALLEAISATGAESVWVTHGYRAPLVRWLQEQGLNAIAIDTRFEGETSEAAAGEPEI